MIVCSTVEKICLVRCLYKIYHSSCLFVNNVMECDRDFVEKDFVKSHQKKSMAILPMQMFIETGLD